MEVMESYFKKNYPDIVLPLIKTKSSGKGNRGYGSGLDDYTWMNIRYFSNHDVEHEHLLFADWDDNYPHSDEKWSVTPKFEPMYNIFGEQNFENFIKYYFNFDITDKMNKKVNWMFD